MIVFAYCGSCKGTTIVYTEGYGKLTEQLKSSRGECSLFSGSSGGPKVHAVYHCQKCGQESAIADRQAVNSFSELAGLLQAVKDELRDLYRDGYMDASSVLLHLEGDARDKARPRIAEQEAHMRKLHGLERAIEWMPLDAGTHYYP